MIIINGTQFDENITELDLCNKKLIQLPKEIGYLHN